MKYVIVIVALIVSVSTKTYADTHCIGKVKNLGVTRDGMVHLVQTSGFMWTRVCSLKKEELGVSPDICKVWYQKLNVSYLTGRDVSLSFLEQNVDCRMPPGPVTTPIANIENT